MPFSKTNFYATPNTGGNPVKALFDSLVRTFVPIIVGAVISFFVTSGIELDPEFEGALFLLVTAGFQGAYYLAARLLEIYVTPKFGVLLGLAKQPAYGPVIPGESLRGDFK